MLRPPMKRDFFTTFPGVPAAARCLCLGVVMGLLGVNFLPAAEPESRWWKGNLHTHSLWSDGDDYPEMIVEWYQREGYHFLALSDHNVLLEGQKWVDATNNAGGTRALERYRARFGAQWVEQRQAGDRLQVRLKPLGEFRHLFEEPQRFLLLPAMEITDRHLAAPVHINATNLRDHVPPRSGSSVYEVMQNNVNAVLEQREATGQLMFPHLNHPNFVWGVTAEELMRVEGERFFEVYNGHPAVRNEGDDQHAGTERMWDIILTWRLAVLGLEPMFGLATDDSHHYHEQAVGKSNSGRGWVMVRAAYLTPEHLIRALEAGDFYASSGVLLHQLERTADTLKLEIAAESGVRYRTQFIGTRKNFDRTNTPVRNAAGEALRVTHRYSDEVGEVLAEVIGTSAAYTLKGDELYVRAKVISSKVKSNPYAEGEFEAAWTQPLIPAQPAAAP
ncbi:MAG TPA: hypothetical protein VLD18_12015 [Verrucomicrobiae bacterium]|nr:hypothetical protein [Verrucomicrobiae bacterium]